MLFNNHAKWALSLLFVFTWRIFDLKRIITTRSRRAVVRTTHVEGVVFYSIRQLYFKSTIHSSVLHHANKFFPVPESVKFI